MSAVEANRVSRILTYQCNIKVQEEDHGLSKCEAYGANEGHLNDLEA
jgi:hypothetical protein